MTRLYANTAGTRILTEGPLDLPDRLVPFQNSRRRRRSFPLCADVLRRLYAANPEAEIDEELRARVNYQRLAGLRTLLVARDRSDFGIPGLMPHQRSGARWLVSRGRGILADSQGTGKTVTSLVASSLVSQNLVVVCSNTKRTDWVEHIRRWTDLEPSVIESSDPPRSPGVGEALVLGYEAARRHSRDISPKALIIDEAHNLRNRKTQQYKGVARLAHRSKYLYLLTATPIVNGPDDVWALLHMVDRKRFSSYWDIVSRFLHIERGYFGVKVGTLRVDEEQAFWSLLGEYMLQRSKDESILPAIRRRVVSYRMHGEQARLYRELVEKDVAVHEGVEVETIEMVAKVTRLRQVALDPSLVWPDYRGPSKVDRLVQVVSEDDSASVVFTMFADLAVRAVEALEREGISARALTGAVSSRGRDALLESFAAGEFQVLVVTHGTGGEGLNLVAARRAIFLDLNWHPAGNEQARDRIYRYGQTAEEIDLIYIRAEESIEQHVLAILREKKPVTAAELGSRLGTISSVAD